MYVDFDTYKIKHTKKVIVDKADPPETIKVIIENDSL